MGSKMLHQAAKFIRDRRNNRRWLAFVLCLAVVVAIGTFWVLARQGKALEDTEKVLICEMGEHAHGDGCYDENGDLICQEEEHQHSDDCYETKTKETLICGEPEISEEHVHDDGSFQIVPADDQDVVPDIPEEEVIDSPDSIEGENYALALPDDGVGDVSGTDVPAENKADVPEIIFTDNSTDISGNDADEIDYSDLSNFTTGVTIRNGSGDTVVEIDKDGNVKVNDPLYIGENYKITISFAEIQSQDGYKQFKRNDNGGLTYQIPGNFQCKAKEDCPLYVKGTDEVVGTYSIDQAGLLTVHYKDGYVEDYENVTLDIELEAAVISNGSEKEAEIDFGEDVKINVTLRNDAEIKTQKTAGSYDPSTRTISYEVRVDVIKGTVKELRIKDKGGLVDSNGRPLVLNGKNELFTLVSESVEVTDLKGNPLTFTDQAGSPISADDLRLDEVWVKKPFSAGEGILLTYKMKVDDDFYRAAYVSGQAKNTIDVAGKTEGEDAVDTADAWKSFQNTSLRKNGELIEENGVKAIKWTIIAGDGYTDLTGKWVVDTLKKDGQMSYYQGQPVTIIPLDSAGKELNAGISRNWENDARLHLSKDGKTFEVQLPESGEIPDKCRGFKITYYTVYTGEPQYNDNKVEIRDTNFKTDGQGIPGIVKEVTGADEDYIYFEISMDVPAGLKGNTFYLEDALQSGNWSDPEYIEYVENRPEIKSVIARTESGAEIVFREGYQEDGENTYQCIDSGTIWHNNSYHGFYLGFNMIKGDADHFTCWNINESSTLTVTYQIPTSAKTGTEWGKISDKTLNDLLNEGKLLWNEVRLYYNSTGDFVSSGDGYQKPSGLDKAARITEDGYVEYTVTFDNGGITENAVLPENISEFVFVDEFDPRMTYEEGSLEAKVYWRRSRSPIVTYTYTGNAGDGSRIRARAADFKYKEGSIEDTSQKEENIKLYYGSLDSVIKDRNLCKEISLTFTYRMKVKEEELDKAVTEEHVSEIQLHNKAVLNWKVLTDAGEKEGSFGPAEETVDYKTGVIQKSSSQIGVSDQLEFTIELNSSRADLAGGGTYMVTDKMSPNLSLIWNTIRVEYCDEEGKWIEFDNETMTYTATYDEDSNTVTFTLPDELYIRITYKTRITGEDTIENVENTASLIGKYTYTDSVNAEYEVDRTNGGTTGSNFGFTLIKQNSDDSSQQLPDVEFALYTENEKDKAADVPGGVKETITYQDGGKDITLYYYRTCTTKEDGSVTIDKLSDQRLYALAEQKTPAGYQSLKDPIYFYVETAVSGAGRAELIRNGEPYVVKNTPTYYILPKTGSSGMLRYSLGGILLLAFGTALTLAHKTGLHRRRKEEP